MFDKLKETLVDMVTSKKFVTAIATAIATGLMRIGLEIPIEDLATVLSPILVYIAGQSITDMGKEAKKVELKLKRAA